MATQLGDRIIPEFFELWDLRVIFGGRPAVPGEFPHMVSTKIKIGTFIKKYNKHFIGNSKKLFNIISGCCRMESKGPSGKMVILLRKYSD